MRRSGTSQITATAAAIGEAVAMPRQERVTRWRSMFDHLVELDVDRWRTAFLSALEPAGQALRRVV